MSNVENAQLESNFRVCEAYCDVLNKFEEMVQLNPEYTYKNYDIDSMYIEYENILYSQRELLNRQACAYFNEYEELCNDDSIITESTKENPIKKFFGLIMRGIRVIVNFVRSIISSFKHKPKNSADGVAEKAGMKRSKTKVEKKVKIDAVNENGVEVQFDPNFASKELSVAIENGEYIVGPVMGIDTNKKFKVGYKNGFRYVSISKFNAARMFIESCEKHLIDDLANSFEKLTNSIISKSCSEEIGIEFSNAVNNVIMKNLINIAGALIEQGNLPINYAFKFKISAPKLKEYTVKLTNLEKVFEKLQNTVDEKWFTAMTMSDKNTLNETLKALAEWISAWTMGLTCLGNEIKEIYKVDAKYKGSCKDLNQLDEFANNMINNGIPTKYVAYNLWYVLDYDLDNRELFFTSKTKPRWGQTRIVFFPTKDGETDKVIKVATNMTGIRANRKEKKTYDEFQNNPTEISINSHKQNAGDCLAKPLTTYPHSAVVVYEKLGTNINKIKAELVVRQFKLNFPDIPDIHSGNIGVSNGTYKLIDYAL
jgi:hypothetical protein